MSNLINNIKKHKIAALVSLTVLVGLIAVVILVMKKGSSDTKPLTPSESAAGQQQQTTDEKYFEQSDYPVRITTSSKGDMRIELDGTRSPDSSWSVVCDDTEGSVLTYDTDGEEKEGKLAIELSPVSIGYATFELTRSGEIAGYKYDAVSIIADVYVYSDDDDKLRLGVADMNQKTANAGALDTDTPYILSDSRVLLPGGGDWQLFPMTSDDVPVSIFSIYEGVEGDGTKYYSVERDLSAVAGLDGDQALKALENARLLLVSESLGIEQELAFDLSSNKTWELSISDTSEKPQTADESADSSESEADDEASSAESEAEVQSRS